MKSCAFMLLVGASLALSACGSKSAGPSTNTQPPPSYTIGGSVSGLSGSGLVLQNNAGNNLSITSNGAFSFTTAITSGSAYKVTVLTSPSNPTQTCAVTGGSGTASAKVTSVQIACTTVTYTIGGTVSGLSGTGLELQDNSGDNLSVTANGTFTFATQIASGANYSVTVLTQPTGPAQSCIVTSGASTANANVTSVQVACTTLAMYKIGGTVSGLTGTGLKLQDNGGDDLSVTANGAFTFLTQIASGSTYNVTVLTQPTAQNCVVTGGTAIVTANVTNVQVTCANVPTYSIGGTVSGLSGPGLELQDNGGDDLPILATQTSFTFLTPVASGSKYNVKVLNEPFSPPQVCSVTNGSGTVSANVTNVLITCSSVPNEWTWVNGSDLTDQIGTYGTLGTADPANIPGSRAAAVSWTDVSGNLWLFGGYGRDSVGSSSYLNDLWEYSAGEWTWIAGSNLGGQNGTYGTLGTAAAGNIPGARQFAVKWVDTSGDLWLFGGYGAGANGYTVYLLNDLWKYSAGQWTWESGSDTWGQQGTYGTLGIAASGNVPGAREYPVTWIDSAGNLWLFGGWGADSTGATGFLNDLWMYGAGDWTWMGGSNVVNKLGVYGTRGTGASGNIPGARQYAQSWTDTSGNFWLFGGYGYGSSGNPGTLNDLWKYSTGEWTWESGGTSIGQLGNYGTEGIAASTNVPGSRGGASAWIDTVGNFWLFGGQGLDSAGAYGNLNDLWKYNAGAWTWMNGAKTHDQLGIYGTLGTTGSGNTPGGRYFSVSWPQASGNLWLFGGSLLDQSTGSVSYFNDLWDYAPSTTAAGHKSGNRPAAKLPLTPP